MLRGAQVAGALSVAPAARGRRVPRARRDARRSAQQAARAKSLIPMRGGAPPEHRVDPPPSEDTCSTRTVECSLKLFDCNHFYLKQTLPGSGASPHWTIYEGRWRGCVRGGGRSGGWLRLPIDVAGPIVGKRIRRG